MATTTSLMTFAQFEQMPDNGRRYELRNGELIELPIPLHDHFHIQLQLRDLLTAAGGLPVAWAPSGVFARPANISILLPPSRSFRASGTVRSNDT